MDSEFKEWIIKRHEELRSESKKTFLRNLKFSSDKTFTYIRYNIESWISIFIVLVKRETIWSYDAHSDSMEILAAFRAHFAKEMESITE